VQLKNTEFATVVENNYCTHNPLKGGIRWGPYISRLRSDKKLILAAYSFLLLVCFQKIKN
jgi:hypothetical protein